MSDKTITKGQTLDLTDSENDVNNTGEITVNDNENIGNELNDERFNRRNLLASVGVGIGVSLSGCLSDEDCLKVDKANETLIRTVFSWVSVRIDQTPENREKMPGFTRELENREDVRSTSWFSIRELNRAFFNLRIRGDLSEDNIRTLLDEAEITYRTVNTFDKGVPFRSYLATQKIRWPGDKPRAQIQRLLEWWKWYSLMSGELPQIRHRTSCAVIENNPEKLPFSVETLREALESEGQIEMWIGNGDDLHSQIEINTIPSDDVSVEVEKGDSDESVSLKDASDAQIENKDNKEAVFRVCLPWTTHIQNQFREYGFNSDDGDTPDLVSLYIDGHNIATTTLPLDEYEPVIEGEDFAREHSNKMFKLPPLPRTQAATVVATIQIPYEHPLAIEIL